MSHDFKTFKITCEDLTEFKLGNKFPIANVGFGNNIVNVEDKNKPIPVLYGHVDRAPAILLKSNIAECDTEFDTYVLCDDVLTEDRKIDLGGFIGEYDDNFVLTGTNSTCPLFIYKGEEMNLELWHWWILTMVTINTVINSIVFIVGRKFKKVKKK